MKILITAGGTSEKIDHVRSITNHSTGKLGSLIAEAFLAQGATVDYITTASAIRPKAQPLIRFYQIEDTQELLEILLTLLEKTEYDAVIHSMAVSDFTPVKNLSQEIFLEKLNQLTLLQKKMTAKDLSIFLNTEQTTESKISSNTDQLYLILEKTPKVIQQIKKKQPSTLLVSFKLLVDVSKEELFSVAKKSLEKTQADYVLANDLTSIQQEKHTGYLLNNKGELVGQAHSKEKIAQLIVKTITTSLS